jgi:hypothetical protein
MDHQQADGGNDLADELVQCGKTGGPYCRVREGGGEGEGRYGAATTAALATPTEGDSAMGQIYGSVPAGGVLRRLTPCSMRSTHFLRE